MTSKNPTIAQFASFLAKYNFSTHSKGATQAEVDALERKCGRTFPSAYREFLCEFGANLGQLRIGGDAWATIEALMSHYDDPAEMADTPEEAIVISTSGLSDSLMIDCDGSVDGGPVRTFGCDNPRTVSESFRHLLFQAGWAVATVYRTGTSFLTAAWSNQDLTTTVSQLEKLGFQPLWFSNASCVYTERADAWAVASTWQGTTYVSLRASAPATERKILDTLAATLGPPTTHHYTRNTDR